MLLAMALPGQSLLLQERLSAVLAPRGSDRLVNWGSLCQSVLTSASQTLTPRAAERSALTRARSEAARAASVARSSAQTIANSRSTSSRRGGRFSCCSRSTAGGSLYCWRLATSCTPRRRLPRLSGAAAWCRLLCRKRCQARLRRGAVGSAAPHHAVSDVLPQKSCLIISKFVLARHEPNALSPQKLELVLARRAKTSFAQILKTAARQCG